MNGIQALLILGALIAFCIALWADRKHQKQVQQELDRIAPKAQGSSDDWDFPPRQI